MNEKELVEMEHLKFEISQLKCEIAKRDALQNQNQIIWGKGWYAMYNMPDNNWWVAPIEFFDKNHHCPDGWEWEIPEGYTEEEFDEFVENNGCEPNPPKDFSFCMEMCIKCDHTDLSYEEQEAAFIQAGYTIKEFKF